MAGGLLFMAIYVIALSVQPGVNRGMRIAGVLCGAGLVSVFVGLVAP